STLRCRRIAPSSAIKNGIMVACGPPVARTAYRSGTIKRILLQARLRGRHAVHWHDPERWPAAIDHSELGALSHACDDFRQGSPQLFGINQYIHRAKSSS